MKIMVVSDLHGSARYSKKAVEAFIDEKADKFLILGDVLYHGARNDLPEEYSTKTVTNILNSIKDKIMAVKGNCDSEVDEMVLEFPLNSDYITFQFNGKNILATHGHKLDDHLRTASDSIDVVLFGHTHIGMIEKKDKMIFANPGSMPIPKGKHSGYLVLQDDCICLKDQNGNTIICEKL